MKSNTFINRTLLIVVVLAAAVNYGEELGENLIHDGGMEEWKETGPNQSWWNYLAVRNKAWLLTKNKKGNLLTPKIFSQFLKGEIMKQEKKDVHSGKKALRLKGQFYLRESKPGAYKTREGDEYIVQYWAKGTGQTAMYMHVYGKGGAQIVKQTGKPNPNQWTLIEERIQVTGNAPTTIFPRLSASDEMLIDDVVIRKVLREEDVKLQSISSELTERVAFASKSKGRIKVDGRLDEPSWFRAVKVGGLRYYRDQTKLAPFPCYFRVLYDDQTLYFGIEVLQPNSLQISEELKNNPLKKKDGTLSAKNETFTGRHSVEVFLQPPNCNRYYQLVVSMDGYRYDGLGKKSSWNGKWQFAVQPKQDRWIVELKIPASDFELDKLKDNSNWQLNLCVNRPGGGMATWSAVGGNFHNPSAFGKMILSDFAVWRKIGTENRKIAQQQIEKESRLLGLSYNTRLAEIKSYLKGISTGGKQSIDWEEMMKQYGVLNFADYSYRCIQEEIKYQSFIRAR